MKILVVNWKHPRARDAGGAERYVERIADAWSEMGHAVTLFVPSADGQGQTRTRCIEEGTRRTVFRRARRYLRRHGSEYDRVVESVSTRPFFCHQIVGRRAIALYHQMAGDVWMREFPLPVAIVGRYIVEPRWLRAMRSARVVAVSPSTAADLASFGIRTEAIVPPGCDLPAMDERAAPGLSPRLVYVGRMVRAKRPEDALAAFALVRLLYPAGTLDVVGDGYLRERLQRRRDPGVTFHGYVTEADKEAILSDAHVLLLPATREGWGIVAMEAASHGVPVIAYDVPGVRDAIAKGSTGILTRPTPQALAAAAIPVLSDGDTWRRLSRASRVWAEGFTWERTASALIGVLADGHQEAAPHHVLAATTPGQ